MADPGLPSSNQWKYFFIGSNNSLTGEPAATLNGSGAMQIVPTYYTSVGNITLSLLLSFRLDNLNNATLFTMASTALGDNSIDIYTQGAKICAGYMASQYTSVCAGNMTAGTWYQAAATVTQAGLITLYLNGA